MVYNIGRPPRNEFSYDRRLRRFGPKVADHPSVGAQCSACSFPFKEGDYTTLVPLGPGLDPEDRRLCFEGRAYNAICAEVHWACATGDTGE